MKPTITNAFTVGSDTTKVRPSRPGANSGKTNRMRGSAGPHHKSDANPFGVILAPMQADLREASFGFSLELSPIQAVDAVHALLRACPPKMQFLVNVEQSAWRDGNADAKLAAIADRVGIEPVEVISSDQIVLDATSLQALIAMSQPLRMLVTAVDGPIEPGDAHAINKAIESGKSPLIADLRALAALEVLGDSSLVLHTPVREIALNVVAENFLHYLAAILDKPAESFAAPELSQIEFLLQISGALTVRPIETQVQPGSIDIGVNTSSERFTQPANASIIYDRPSNSWHVE